MKQPKPRRRQYTCMSERSQAYRQLWRIVDGAVFDALYTHQDYLTDKGRMSARESIVKRVTGAVLGYAEQSVEGRSVVRAAVARGEVSQPGPARSHSWPWQRWGGRGRAFLTTIFGRPA